MGFVTFSINDGRAPVNNGRRPPLTDTYRPVANHTAQSQADGLNSPLDMGGIRAG